MPAPRLQPAAPAGSPGVAVGQASPSAPPVTVKRSRWWVEALLIVWLAWVYDATTNLAPLRVHAALAHARSILHLEQSLGLDPERSLDHWLAGHHTLALVVSDYYDNAHFIVTFGLLGWLWWARADIYRPLRNILVLTNVIAFVVFWRFPVAPPRMLGGFTDVVASSGAIGSWHGHSGLASHANELAALPSLHIAWASWCTLAVWQATRRVWARALATAYPFVTTFAVLSTGNHFLMDVLAGLLLFAVSVALVWILEALRERRRKTRSRAPAKALAQAP
ncbi:MAG TPA: phosphatase PAP2 family protein [Solirubrobacteraceae bacterium]|nr:phosphatase PAP2 family protein [Solirubrobacteraceae bacterium]